MSIMALSIVISCMSGIVGAVFSAVRKSKYYFYSSIWSALGSVIFNIVLIPVWGIWGAVYANMFAMILMLISRFIYVKRYVRLEFSFIYVYNIIVYTCIFGVSVIFRNWIGFTVIVLLVFLYLFMNKEAFSFFYRKKLRNS